SARTRSSLSAASAAESGFGGRSRASAPAPPLRFSARERMVLNGITMTVPAGGGLTRSLPVELVQQERISFRVQADGHAAHWRWDNIALKDNPFRFQVSDQLVEVLDLEGNGAARGCARLVRSEIGDRKAAASRQIIFDPPALALIAGRASF